ncbi:short-chain dehydrogenase [Agromyces rhizosphaerae]|uniref:Short-chain dehydrogenase n=1 Tax=Agromyces rhizosphaerae TaxID=88374 RepID=A0A9W6CQC8_9MICO|nr:SDR family oxidoreductase [Agromyces rhizosphaerae]GLI26921.1 short-chain dehydrogenase [Agromyces rhizosphaerae]
MDAAKVLWVTGGGSGMGRATAERAAAAGWTIAVSGRRTEALQATAAAIEAAGGSAIALPLDVTDASGVRAAHDAVLERFGRIDALVLSAGRNIPRRTWADQSMAEFESVVATNLTGVASVIDAALPSLRLTRGRVVCISSYSGWIHAPLAGIAYSASKTAVGSLCKSLNDEEAEHGVQACNLCPGDVATDFLEQRPVVPDADARTRMLTPDDIARSVMFVLDSPAHVRIDELVISPNAAAAGAR